MINNMIYIFNKIMDSKKKCNNEYLPDFVARIT